MLSVDTKLLVSVRNHKGLCCSDRHHIQLQENHWITKCVVRTHLMVYLVVFISRYFFSNTQRFFERIDLHKVEDYGCCMEEVEGMSDANKK